MIFFVFLLRAGAVAIELAARRESAVRGVVVENTFTSIDDMVRTHTHARARARAHTHPHTHTHTHTCTHTHTLSRSFVEIGRKS